MRHRLLIALAAVVSGMALAARTLARKRAGTPRVEGAAEPAFSEREPLEVPVDPAGPRGEDQEPPTEAAASWLPAEWRVDDSAEAQVSVCRDSSHSESESRWLPQGRRAGDAPEGFVASGASVGRRRAFRLTTPTRRQSLGGLALALAMTVAATLLLLPAVRNVGGDRGGVAIAKTHGHGRTGAVPNGGVVAQPGVSAGGAAVGGAVARAAAPAAPAASARTTTPSKSGAGATAVSSPSSAGGGSPRPTPGSTSSPSPGSTPNQTPSSSGSTPASSHSSTSLPVSTSSVPAGRENTPTAPAPGSGSGSGSPVQSAVSTVQSTASSATSTAQTVVSTATSAVPAPPSPPKLP